MTTITRTPATSGRSTGQVSTGQVSGSGAAGAPSHSAPGHGAAAPAQPATIVKSPSLIAVASGKGGVGKTFFSISLAHALARHGRKVLLLDGDLGLANVDVQLGVMPGKDLGTVIAGKATLAQACVKYDAGGFDLLAGRSGAGSLAALPPTRLSLLAQDINALSRTYDYLIMDLGAGIDRTNRLLSLHSGTRLIVATAEPTSMTDAYAFIKVSLADDPKADIRVVINQARTQAEGERTFQALHKACTSFLKMTPDLLGVVRKDRKVLEAIRAQTPLFAKFPGADAAVDIQTIASRLLTGTRF